MEINIGIGEQDRAAIAEGLSRLLADTYTLYLKTHNFHWNVTGPMFNTLHLMFEGQYTELAVAVDDIAERIRALGFPRPHLRRLRPPVVHQGGGRRSGSRGDDPATGPGPGSRGAHRPQHLPAAGQGQRRTHRRPAHPTYAGA